ncbi:hypothetical protein ACQ4PT_020338 [Festuca glaucescens]
MEAALVSAATGALRPVIGKLATLVGNEYKRFKGLSSEIKSLTRELVAMDAFLLKMSEEEYPDVQDKAWMTEVRELSYDMEDSIDDFVQRVDDKDTKPDGFMEKIKHSLGKLVKMKTRRRICNEIQDLKKQILDVCERNERYRTRQAFSNINSATVDPRALAIFEHASKLVGIDEPKAELIKYLTEEDGCASKLQQQQQQHQLKLISIVGSGGMGKTTIANQVYQELKENFDCWAFLSVSRNPDMINILRTILSKVSNQRYADTEEGSLQQLIINITNFLQDKRYFIVVDDIWDVDTWDVIKCAFPMTSSGSRIITTTRMNDVAHSCSSSFNGHIYNIRPLNIKHSRQLFHRRLFNSEEDCPLHLKAVSDEILQKCDGLPLAIIAISGLLANKESTKDKWDEVKNSIGRALERNPSVEGMMKILSLSYYDLPPHLRTCLLYLSIFPEDYNIHRAGLIRRWIAEGFIHKEGFYTAHDLGEIYFNELINRSLIQPGETDENDKLKSCRVHDTILDFIISKSIEENFVTLVGVPNLNVVTQSKVRRLSVQVSNHENSILATNMVLSHVRSLNFFWDSGNIPSADEFRYLRLLDIRNVNQQINLHLKNIGKLFQLRYLKLRGTYLRELPKEIGHLRCLEMLDIRGTRVSELPAAVVNLENLMDLLTDDTVVFPDGIAKMQALEVLKMVTTLEQSYIFLRDLGQLKNMRKMCLDFEHGYDSEDSTGVKEECMEAIASSLRKLGTHNLCSLTIIRGSILLEGPFCPGPHSLQKLMTYESAVSRIPDWIGSLINLQQLRLRVEGVSQEDLCTLGALPALLILDLEGTASSKGKLRVTGEVGFQCLRKFWYDIQEEGMDLMFEVGSMPKLEKLTMFFDADETECLSTSGAFHFGIENLPCLLTVICTVYGCQRSIEAAKAAVERDVSTHPNHTTLVFEHKQ